MLRTVVILFVAACDVGALPGYGPDAKMMVDMGSGMGSDCEAINAAPPDGHHNPGMTCIQAGCHLTGQTGLNAPAYTYGGTLYHEAAGTTPFPGATIIITKGGTVKKVVTANNGNFWMTAAPAGLDSPDNAMTATTKSSGCPDTMSMVGMLVQGGGNCNNCHKNGGTTSPIHLP